MGTQPGNVYRFYGGGLFLTFFPRVTNISFTVLYLKSKLQKKNFAKKQMEKMTGREMVEMDSECILTSLKFLTSLQPFFLFSCKTINFLGFLS